MMLFLFSLFTEAQAVPVQLSQQGRLLDSNGVAVNGQHMLSFALYDAPLGGNMVWGDSVQISFDNGYYSTLLGNNLSNPLDDSVLAGYPLYLELEVDGNGPVGIRKEVVSSPYARRSSVSQSLAGGTVDATSISVGGQLIIDGTGSWVGPAMVVGWTDLLNVPSDIADGDNDSLAGIACTTGEILGWNGSQWACASDNGLSEAEVEAFITNDPLDFAIGSTVGGQSILSEGSDGTLSALTCQSGDVPKYDGVLGQWSCDMDLQLSEAQVESFVVNGLPAFDLSQGTTMSGSALLTESSVLTVDWVSLSNVPADIADGDADSQLTEAQVEGFVTNGLASFDLTPGTTLGGETIMTSTACGDGEVLSYSASLAQWDCTNFQQLLDNDGDGVMAWNDCDDSEVLIGSNVTDQDCDGIVTADDCDDFDPLSESNLNDGDCDGVLTADDCDDGDTTLGDIALDGDCDGSLTGDDCDDANPNRQGAFGSTDCPLASCLEIQQQGFSTGTGVYTIDPTGTDTLTVYCDMATDGGGWTLVGAWGPMVGYTMQDYTAGISPHEVDDAYQYTRPSGGPTHYSRDVINALFQNGQNHYMSLTGSGHNGYVLALHAKDSPDPNYDPFKGVYHTSYMKSNGFTAYVDTGGDYNPLPLTSPNWSLTTVSGRNCPDNDYSGCYHYLPDDITSGSQWLFRENADDCPFSSNNTGPNVPSLLFIR